MDKKDLAEKERRTIFQEINNWLRHADHLVWTITSLFISFNLFLLKESGVLGTNSGSSIKIKYLSFYLLLFISIIIIYLFIISIIMITLDLQELLSRAREELKIENFVKSLVFRPFYFWKGSGNRWKGVLRTPWGLLMSVITLLLSMFWIEVIWGIIPIIFIVIVLLAILYILYKKGILREFFKNEYGKNKGRNKEQK